MAVAGHSAIMSFARTPRVRFPAHLALPSSLKISDLAVGSVTSELCGLKISSGISEPAQIFSPRLPTIQRIVARRLCRFTGKKANLANKVSFSNHKTKKLQLVNLQYKVVWWKAGKRYLKLQLPTKALKTIEKNGLDAVTNEAGIDLRKE